MARLGIRARVVLTLTLSLIVVFAAICYLLVVQNKDRATKNLTSSSKSFAALATKPIGDAFLTYKDSGTIRIAQQVERFTQLYENISYVTVVDVEGRVLFDSQNQSNRNVPKELAETFQQKIINDSEGYPAQIVEPYIEDTGSHRYTLVYGLSSNALKQEISDVVRLIVYVGIIVLILSIVLTTVILNRLFLKPLSKVSNSAQKISSGDLTYQIPATRNDEIGDLAASVNKMAEYLKADIAKLKELDKLKTEFMMITSHNLRSPITVMEGYLEMAEEATNEAELKGILKTLKESVAHLHRLAEDVLTISTIESGEFKINKNVAKIHDLLSDLGNEYNLLARRRKIELEFKNEVPADFEMKVSSSHLRSALGNLVDNAIKFSEEKGKVEIAAKVAGNNFIFEVTDHGIGIDDNELPKLFTKFHRGTDTLTYNYEGLGIGLYLTKLIVTQHDGTVEAESQKGHGSTFTVKIPVS